MSEHMSDSSRLPLRAMVMVLLFLGVILLLVGFQSMRSSGDRDDGSAPVAAEVTASTPEVEPAAADKPVVRVYNISDEDGVAGHTADELRGAGWNVTEVDNLSLPDVDATTVYFGETVGERDAADAVGQFLHAPVEPRAPDLAEQPPGIIVVVAS